MIGAIGLFAVVVAPLAAALAGLLRAAVLAGAVATNLRVKVPVGTVVPSLGLLVLALVVSAGYLIA